jgi:glycosyltransferase involved in cell wall biosynthesis
MNKSICFIGGGLRGGGQERALTSLANHFAQAGQQVIIINLFKTDQFFSLEKSIKVVWPSKAREKYHRLIYAALLLPWLRKEVKRINPDVLLSFGEWFNPFVILSTRFLNRPLFVFDRMGPQIHLGFLIENARKIFYRFANGIIVQTEAAKDIVAKKTRAKNIRVIPNPVNAMDAKGFSKNKQIVSVGRLSKEKGHLILLRAFSKIKHKDWSLHLVGDGPERALLEEKANSLGVSDRVVFHGHLKDFSQILGESEIFVLPSFYEGFPNALLESMSIPLACISSNCVAGPSDIIKHGKNGLLVEPGNVDELAQAIDLLISDKEMREKLANEAYKVREKYQFDKIALQYLDFITQSINNS